MSKRKYLFVCGFLAVLCIILVCTHPLAIQYLPKIPVDEHQSFDIWMELGHFPRFHIIRESWTINEKTWRAFGLTFIRLDDWDQFEQCMDQNRPPLDNLYLDESAQVIWYSTYYGAIFYYEY